MKYKYLEGSAEDFDGAPEWATTCVWNDKAGESFCYWLNEDEGRAESNGVAMNWDGQYGYRNYIKARREPVGASEVSGDTHLSQAIQNTAQDVSKIIDKEIKGSLITTTEALISERGSRYGKFKDGAEIMQSLKDTMRDVDGWNNLTASQKEALDMIQHKIGLILNGDPTYDDSWKDIAGYATLIVNELNGEVK